MSKKLKIKLLNENATIPTRSHDTDAGLDIYNVKGGIYRTGDKIPLGIAVEIPKGYMGQIIERSSIAVSGIIFAKAPIDSGYRGEIHAIIGSCRYDSVKFTKGQKIAQLVITKIITPKVNIVKELSKSDRGEKAFGSTDKINNEKTI